jgi:hypothetical protein
VADGRAIVIYAINKTRREFGEFPTTRVEKPNALGIKLLFLKNVIDG